MQLLATAEQMQHIDRTAIMKYSIPGAILMENAGRAVVDELEKRVDRMSSQHCVILCGKGNNGGDGFVIARHLANKGVQVHVALLCKPREVKGDARVNLSILLKMSVAQQVHLHVQEISSSTQFSRLPKASIIIDAIFGTGFTGRVHGIQLRAIEWLNRQKCFVASVDIPSGANATTGIVENIAVKADLTVTMGLVKIGHYVGAGRDHSGQIVVADISIPPFLYQSDKKQAFRILAEDVVKILPKRPISAHKYSVGKIFVLAGSRGLTGAPFLCSQAAMKTGAGAVVLGVPRSVHSILARKVTEVMVTPLEETSDGTIALDAMKEILEKIKWADVVAIGPGLSRNAETESLVRRLLPLIKKPVVLDADGLNAVASDISILRKRKHPTILTPHMGELSRLTKQDGQHMELHRVEAARNAAKRLSAIVALKGAPTVTGTSPGITFVNSTGNPGMATAGAGDVLTGIIASLVAQGMSAEEATYSGVFVHGMAGDLAAQRFGQRGLLALDLIKQLPDVFKNLEESNPL